jgi:hypothetical protein
MDITTGQRTFCLGLSGLGADGEARTYDVPFVDTAGNNINCNYFKLTTGGGTTDQGAIIAELSGVSMAGDMVSNEISALNASPAASGICGVGLVYGGLSFGETSWHGSNGEVCNGVRLQVYATNGAPVELMLEYGNLLPYNILKSSSYDAGS